jgi:hypothetical protein
MNEERNEEVPTQADVSKMSNEQLQAGINAVTHNMTQKYFAELRQLEQIIGRQVNVGINAKLPDGRKIHIRVR